MRKIFTIAVVMAAFLLTGCEEEFGFEYSAKIKGDADGIVAVEFPDGALDLAGQAALAFKYGNVDTTAQSYSVDQAKFTSNKMESIALAAEDDFAQQFNVAALTGTYDVVIDAWCREKASGVVIKINKRFSNR